MTDFTEKKVQDRVQFFAVGDQVNECLGTVPERFAEAYRTMLRAEGVVPSATLPSNIVPYYAESLAEAFENCHVTCKLEPSAFDLEQQGYDTIIYALRQIAAKTPLMEVIASGNPLLYNVYGMFQQEDRGPEWQGDWRDVLAAIEQHLQRVNYPGNAPKVPDGCSDSMNSLRQAVAQTFKSCDANGDWHEQRDQSSETKKTECSECPTGDCSDCPRKPAHHQWEPV